MHSTREWIEHFRINRTIDRINWNTPPSIAPEEKKQIVKSLQAWQLGETSDGAHLMLAARKYAALTGDIEYPESVVLFIQEEQKHGNNLGRYLDMIGERRISFNWGDSLFRKIRYLNSSMEAWTVTVITVECAAEVYYQSLKDATQCNLLKQICTDILIDEGPHVVYQKERLTRIFTGKTLLSRMLSYRFYKYFYFSVAFVVWMAHRKVFRAGNVSLLAYWRKMSLKFRKNVGDLKYADSQQTHYLPEIAIHG